MDSTLANPYLTNTLTLPPPQTYRYRSWQERGYHPDLRPISSDSECGTLIGQMGWVGAHAHAHEYLWATAGNMGAVLTESVEDACLIPYEVSPRYQLPPQIVVKGLAGRHVLLTKSGSRLDMIGIEHPALNLTLIEVEPDGVHYRMRFGTPDQTALGLNRDGVAPPAPTSEMFHYLLIFEQLESQGFNALVHLQPKFLNLISRTEHGAPDRFYNFLRGYEPETPIIYDASSGIGFVEERAPGIPELSYESLRLFQNGGSPERYILYWVGHGTFSRGSDLLDAYKHAEYFEAAARMAWEANQQTVKAQAYTEEIVSCILREFNANRGVNQNSDADFQDPDTPVHSENVYNYP
ncbi:MAG: class II aldolase/adducin family protein [Candidatus Poribacteria bacterium]|nr:class II aldolase/adducin family protein [Candidatus Poribacteria bacterium]